MLVWGKVRREGRKEEGRKRNTGEINPEINENNYLRYDGNKIEETRIGIR